MKKSLTERIANFLIHLIFIIFCLSNLIPIILTFIVSISDEKSIITKGFSFFPDKISLTAYRMIFSDGLIFNAYGVTILVTVIGTVLSVFLCSMAGYAMSSKKVKLRGAAALYFYIPMVFNAGLVPWYLVVTKLLMLKNSLLALIIPALISPFNIFLLRNYFNTLPVSLSEAAEIDGAKPIRVFFNIILPLSTPVVATVTLFISLGFWNDWVLALWLIDKEKLYPLQYMLFRIQSLISYMQSQGGQMSGSDSIPNQSVQMATMFITIGPIILLYPFIQKYFVKGIMIGAIKG